MGIKKTRNRKKRENRCVLCVCENLWFLSMQASNGTCMRYKEKEERQRKDQIKLSLRDKVRQSLSLGNCNLFRQLQQLYYWSIIIGYRHFNFLLNRVRPVCNLDACGSERRRQKERWGGEKKKERCPASELIDSCSFYALKREKGSANDASSLVVRR